MILKRFYEDQLAHASYLVGCAQTGEAVVIDPHRDINQYLEVADREKLRIVAVTETHIHADYISGSRELGESTGATLYLSDEGDADWKYQFMNEPNVRLVTDGDHLMIGRIRLDFRRTPGHTPEHIAIVLTDGPASEAPLGAFTGDFIFVGDVGRPDLLERAAGFEGTMEKGAHVLFDSLQKFKRDMPSNLMIWPAHGAGSACGKSLGGVPDSVLGYELLANWGIRESDAASFVREVLAGQPEPPAYFKEMKRINKVGPPLLSSLAMPRRLHGEQAKAKFSEAIVLDLRSSEEWLSGAMPDSISLPLGPGFLTWAGSVVPFDAPLALLGSESQVKEANRLLSLIGYDRVVGWATPAILRGMDLVTTPGVSGSEAVSRAESGRAVLLDVRGQRERDEVRVDPSTHIPLGQVLTEGKRLPMDREIIVTCAAGARSPIAIGLLRRLGFTNLVNLTDGVSGCPDGTKCAATV